MSAVRELIETWKDRKNTFDSLIEKTGEYEYALLEQHYRLMIEALEDAIAKDASTTTDHVFTGYGKPEDWGE